MTKLEFGKYYHIFNRGINHCNLFYTSENYKHFLRLYEKYINPIAETYAWVLLKNHFHLLVKIKNISDVNIKHLPDPIRIKDPNYVKKLKEPHLYFSDLFNAYSQAINKQEQRNGSLFQRAFQRIEVSNKSYFKQLVIYIHSNPVHHGFTDDFKEYPWSSYGSIISFKPTKVRREDVLGWFNSRAEFMNMHNQEINLTPLNHYILE
jgi:putative transposase